jgi:hypothetical protein
MAKKEPQVEGGFRPHQCEESKEPVKPVTPVEEADAQEGHA